MSNPVTEHLIAYRAFGESGEFYGLADVDLPEVENMTTTIKGAGISGEVEVPIYGHTKSFTIGLSWLSLTKEAVGLSRPGSHLIEFRKALQEQNAATGAYRVVPQKITVRTMSKKLGIGKLAVAEASDTKNELEVVYLRIEQDGVETLEIDKFNYIHKINGVDYLKNVRTALGLE